MSNTPNPKRTVTKYKTEGPRLDYEQEARDLAASVLILVSTLQDWDGTPEGRTPASILSEMVPHAQRILDSPAESRIVLA
jgi:hypothetical protein